MEERQVTVDGETRPLPRPFIVLATQNPIELEGTFPLPEAQLDRFLLRLSHRLPDRSGRERTSSAASAPASPLDELPAGRRCGRGAAAHAAAVRARSTSPTPSRTTSCGSCAPRACTPSVELGASPRGTLALYRAAQALAAIDGRGYVLPDDVKRLAPAVLAHRLITSAQSRLRGRDATELLNEVVASVPAPVEEPEPVPAAR